LQRSPSGLGFMKAGPPQRRRRFCSEIDEGVSLLVFSANLAIPRCFRSAAGQRLYIAQVSSAILPRRFSEHSPASPSLLAAPCAPFPYV